MNVLVIGDVGWRDLYHLGDEAMTEAALQQLAARGVDELVVIGGQADVTSDFYGYPAIERIGFRGAWSRERHEATLATVDRAIAGEGSPTPALAGVIAALEQADALIIAGGGNMNSDHVNHLYERLALIRIARAHDVPVYVVSQTVGPYLTERDAEMVKEILAYARCFAAREGETYRLLLELSGPEQSNVSHMMDDAMMLTTSESDLSSLAKLRLADRYVVGSFTAHSGTSGLSAQEYYAQIARTLDEIAEQLDVDIALVPHAGSLDRSVRKGDQLANDEISAATTSGRVVNCEMLTARQAIALTQGAVLSINTRYHPTVFSPAVGVPSIGIAISYYSSVRMRGANENLGLWGFSLPTASWLTGDVTKAASAIAGPAHDAVAAHLKSVIAMRRQEQSEWWDEIVTSISEDRAPRSRVLGAVSAFTRADWAQGLEATFAASDALGKLQNSFKHLKMSQQHQRETNVELSNENAQLRAQVAQLTNDRARLTQELKASRNRLAARIANRATRLFRLRRR